ncbi:MAG: GNAT family N-acetyltransferase [Defluviitaleaceae bacterium]|nr:GNAT family N-acetyltransferase [Defluviitaleaceae bacterium]
MSERIKTPRLIIRRFTPEDGPDLQEYISQEEAVKFEPYGVYTKEESAAEAVLRSMSINFWAVCLKKGGKLIGNLYMREQKFGAWELGYIFNSNYWHAGYATEAAAALVGDVFAHSGARRVVAMCNPENTASWRLLERLGMRREGHLRQNVWFKKDENGRPIWTDTYEYGLLASEWRQ